jgi:two-component sensor histidine kinase/CheY-like chemotaxis protein
MSAIAKLSSAKATSVSSFVRDLDGRIQAISGAHTLLRAHAWNGADLVDLVNETMAPFRSSGNISVEGGHIMLEPRVAQTFALMLHELATNAVKYGALSGPKGRINIKWSGSSDVRKLKFVWQETGGPIVHQPDSTGFGSRVLKSAAKDVGAMAACSFKAEGFEFTLTAGPTPIATDARIEEETMPAALPAQTGLRILVVEDEPIVALQIQGDLESDGHFVIGPAGTAEQGLELAAGETFDYAILDVRLGQTTSESIANKLIERQIPFVFSTGYSDISELPVHLRIVKRLSKPFILQDFRDMLAATSSETCGSVIPLTDAIHIRAAAQLQKPEDFTAHPVAKQS